MILLLRPTPNNFFFSLLTDRGDVVFWVTAGSQGLHGPRRSTPLAAELAAKTVGRRLRKQKIRFLRVQVVGPFGSRSKAALRGLAAVCSRSTFRVVEVVPPLAHNGVRLAKRRRV